MATSRKNKNDELGITKNYVNSIWALVKIKALALGHGVCLT